MFISKGLFIKWLNRKMLFISILTLIIFSCKKETTGRINVKVNYNYSVDNDQTATYSQTVVKLYKDNSLLDTKVFDTNESNVSFGIYEYSDKYSVNCSAQKSITQTSGSISTTTKKTVNASKSFTLKAKDVTTEVTLE